MQKFLEFIDAALTNSTEYSVHVRDNDALTVRDSAGLFYRVTCTRADAPIATTERAQDLRSVYINARLWTDKYGNTYHTALIVCQYADAPTRRFVLPFSYGYGDHYRTTCGELLVEHGVVSPLPDGRAPYLNHTWAADSGIELSSDTVTVTRRKDLHHGGKASTC